MDNGEYRTMIRFCKTLPELYLWFREYCKYNLLNDYEIKISKTTQPNGERSYKIEDRVFTKGRVDN